MLQILSLCIKPHKLSKGNHHCATLSSWDLVTCLIKPVSNTNVRMLILSIRLKCVSSMNLDLERCSTSPTLGSQTVKNLPAVQETWVWSLDREDSPGEENGNPLQYSCVENSMDRGAWRAAVHGVAKSQTRLKWFHTHSLRNNSKNLSCSTKHWNDSAASSASPSIAQTFMLTASLENWA